MSIRCQSCGNKIVHYEGNTCPICGSSIKIAVEDKKRSVVIAEILWELIATLKGKKSFEDINKFWVKPLEKYTEKTIREAVKRINLKFEYFPSLKNFIDECEKIEREQKESLEFNLLTNDKLLDFIIEKTIKNPEIKECISISDRIKLINNKNAIIKKAIDELEQDVFDSVREDLLKGRFKIVQFINDLLKGFKSVSQP